MISKARPKSAFERHLQDSSDPNTTELERGLGDWSVNVSPFPIVPVPSFIRLFVMNRILLSLNDENFEILIPQLVKNIKDPANKKIGKTILSRLMKDGLTSIPSIGSMNVNKQTLLN